MIIYYDIQYLYCTPCTWCTVVQSRWYHYPGRIITVQCTVCERRSNTVFERDDVHRSVCKTIYSTYCTRCNTVVMISQKCEEHIIPSNFLQAIFEILLFFGPQVLFLQNMHQLFNSFADKNKILISLFNIESYQKDSVCATQVLFSNNVPLNFFSNLDDQVQLPSSLYLFLPICQSLKGSML